MPHISDRRSHCTARSSLNKALLTRRGVRFIRWDRESIGRRFASPSLCPDIELRLRGQCAIAALRNKKVRCGESQCRQVTD